MDDPMGRVKESDRRAAIGSVQDACRDGLIVEADRDFRVEQIRAARSRTDLDVVTRDLAHRAADRRGSEDFHAGPSPAPVPYEAYPPPTGPPTAPPPVVEQPLGQTAGQPGPSYPPYQPHGGMRAPSVPPVARAGRGAAVATALVVALLVGGGVVSGLLASIQESGDDGGIRAIERFDQEAVPDPGLPAFADPLTPRGFEVMREVLEAETGSAAVLDATLYRDYAMLTVPGRGATKARQYYYDRSGLREFGAGDRGAKPVDLARVEPTVVRRLVRRASTLVDDPDARYLIIRRQDGDDAVLLAYASNAADDTGYVMATLGGRVVRTLP